MTERHGDIEELLDAIPVDHPMESCLAAIGVVAESRRGRRSEVRTAIDALTPYIESTSDDLLAGKTAQRLALASYYLQDYDRATALAERSLDAFTRIGSERLSVTPHSILYNIHHAVTGNYAEAMHSAQTMTELAEIAGDRSYHTVGLIAQYEIAAETGASELVQTIRGRIRQNAGPEQYRERFACRIADFLPCAWSGDFQTLYAGMSVSRDAQRLTRPMRALATSLMGLAAAALGNREEARKLAREAIGQSNLAIRGTAAAYDLRYRLLARAIAAAIYLLAGSKARGQRIGEAKLLGVDPDLNALTQIAIGRDYQEIGLCYRGYAEAIRAARDSVKRRNVGGPITAAEQNVLLLLAEGYTAGQIAGSLGRSVSTVRNQTRSIIDKFEVSGKVAAISHARKVGLLP